MALALAGSTERVDHRSYKEQADAGDLPAGIEPGQKDGPAITNIKRRVVAGKQSLPEWLIDRAIASVQRVARNVSLRRFGWTIFNAGQFSKGGEENEQAEVELFGAVLDGAADFMSMPSLMSQQVTPKPKMKPVASKQNGNHLEAKRARDVKRQSQPRLRRRRGEKSRAKSQER